MAYFRITDCGCHLRVGKQDKPKPNTWGLYLWGACDECFDLLDKTMNADYDAPAFEELYWHLGLDKMGFLCFPRPFFRFAVREIPDKCRGPLDDDYIYDGPIPSRYGMTIEEVANEN